MLSRVNVRVACVCTCVCTCICMSVSLFVYLLCVLLRARPRGALAKDAPVPSLDDLPMMLIREYVRMPYGSALLPFNYCLAREVLPTWAKGAVEAVC